MIKETTLRKDNKQAHSRSERGKKYQNIPCSFVLKQAGAIVLAIWLTSGLGSNNFAALADTATQSAAQSATSADSSSGSTPAAPPTSASDATENYLATAGANGAARWPTSRLPVAYSISEDTTVDGYRPGMKAAVEAAMNAWSNATGGKLLFLPVDAKTAAVHISWTADRKKMNFTRELGHAEVVCDGEGILKTEITLLTKDTDGTAISDAFARRIAMHEIGHTLGILGHSPNPEDVMYASTTPSEAPTLTKKDANTILTLYSPAGLPYTKKIDIVKMTNVGPGASPAMQAIHLNAEATEALKAMKFEVGMQKLEQAHALDPTNQTIIQNLGGTYANIAGVAVMMHKQPDADRYFKKSIAVLELLKNKSALVPVLTNYSTVLKATGRVDEGIKVDAHIRAVNSGK